MRWFALGMVLPLVGVGVLLALKNAEGTTTPAESLTAPTAPIEVAVDSAGELAPLATDPEVLPSVAATDIAVIPTPETSPTPDAPDFHPPLVLPEPEYTAVSVAVKRGDTLERIFRKHGVAMRDLVQIAELPEARDHLRLLKPGDEFEIRHNDGRLVSLYRELDLTTSLLVRREANSFSAEFIERPIEMRRRAAYGRIDTSLFESAAEAGLSDKVIMNLAGIFAWDIDFVLDIRGGDSYYVLYEQVWQNGELVSDGGIVAAEFNNNGRTYRAIRYVDEDGRADYFTPEGLSVRKAFIRAPVDFTRISSRFNPRRRHPILNTIRAHRGVDYAAPSGTPIKAAGDGKVIFRGVKGGYGNTVILQHGGNITTLYAHMSRFNKKVRKGQRARQGDTIGYVGATGLATAAHLHYEYRVNGVHRNPRTVELPQAEPIRKDRMQDFLAKSGPILDELLDYKRTEIASVSSN